MKTWNEWNLNKARPTAFITEQDYKQIQLDAMKEGAKRAADTMKDESLTRAAIKRKWRKLSSPPPNNGQRKTYEHRKTD